jgi:hypothetical protein
MSSNSKSTTNGLYMSREYATWANMIQRCTNTNTANFKYYGGRGIKVCKRWRRGEDGKTGFQCFYEDLGPKPLNLTLERVNNDGNYEPSNCKWATRIAQRNNQRPRNFFTKPTRLNTSGVVGVGFNKKAGKWTARYRKGWLGQFAKFEDAVEARKLAELTPYAYDYKEAA